VPLVFDHFARIPLQAGPGHPVFDFVTTLMRQQRASVKLSGAYHSKRAPDYEDVAPLARTWCRQRRRNSWGSDWPHPTEQHKPDDARLLDVMTTWLGSTRCCAPCWSTTPPAFTNSDGEPMSQVSTQPMAQPPPQRARPPPSAKKPR
jgi:hypothetical protein